MGLHGHGVRDRQLRGPVESDGAPTVVVVRCRRYRCTSCGAVLTVVPRGVCPRRHYGYAAIALALTLWRVVGRVVLEVRRRVCAWPVTTTRTSVWPALRRWRAALGGRFAQQAMGRAPPHLFRREPDVLAFAGGSAMP